MLRTASKSNCLLLAIKEVEAVEVEVKERVVVVAEEA